MRLDQVLSRKSRFVAPAAFRAGIIRRYDEADAPAVAHRALAVVLAAEALTAQADRVIRAQMVPALAEIRRTLAA
ncbi:MAG: hypothetical protein JO165_02555 [Candidatus Eremiobacteraeota bacterium]|nr:hypothetical protein [Candidatus Eremiobacteraeota bacterium]